MIRLLQVPIEQLLQDRWNRIDQAQRRALLVTAVVSLLAFGFEMTNLTLHHDDLTHLMVQKPLVGYYLGRFVHSWIFFYALQGHFAPFLHMALGMLLMCAYGLLVANFWGARRTLDIALVATILCVFPYMAHVYQYNSVMVAYPLAHLLAAAAVVVAARARAITLALAALLFFVAFSIYQAVLANAVTILLAWLLTQTLFAPELNRPALRAIGRSAMATVVAIAVGGILHVFAVSLLDIHFDSAHGADQAFSLGSRLEHGLRFSHAVSEVLRGSRAFFVWPEAYLPQPLKVLHGLLLAAAALSCLLVSRSLPARISALTLLGLVVLSPRTLQFLHPAGSFHVLTLTGYALTIALAVLVILKCSRTLIRNGSAVAAVFLVAGYTMQCSWISTVNHLNTLAHYATLTQILARLRAIPESSWDGKTVAVVGSYAMPSDFPFRPSTGVANNYMTPGHMNLLARLMRDEVKFVRADATLPKVLEYAAVHGAWPHPSSVGVVDGMGVIVFSSPTQGATTVPSN